MSAVPEGVPPLPRWADVAEPWSVGEAVGAGWLGLRRHPVVLVGSFLCLLLAEVLIGVGARALMAALHLNAVVVTRTADLGPPPNRLMPLVLLGAGLLGLLVSVYFSAGIARIETTAARGGTPSLAMLLTGPRVFARMLGFHVVFLVAFVLSIPAMGIPALGLALAPFFIADGDMTLGAALTASWQSLRGYKGKLWLYGFCAGPLLLLAMAAGGVFACVAAPFFGTGQAYIYLRLSGRGELPPFPREFGTRSMRNLLRTTLLAFGTGFVGGVVWVTKLPALHGSAWSLRDTAIRGSAVLLGMGTTIALLAMLLPWILDGLEARTFVSFVGARHVRSQKSGFLTVISVLSICGVALSSCALSSVVSVMGGFSQDLKRKILGNNAHIVIDTVSQSPWDGYDELLARVRATKGVAAATPVVSSEVMVSSPSNLAGVIVRGVDPTSIGNVIELVNNIEVGRFEYLEDPEKLRHLSPDEVIGLGPGGEQYLKGTELPPLSDPELDPIVREAINTGPPLRPGLIVGRELAKTLHVYVGDEVTLVSPLGDLGPMGVMPKTKKFRIAAIFFSGMYEYDASHVYTLIDVAQDYFGLGQKISAVDVKVDDAERAELLTPIVTQAIDRPDLRVRDWREINKNLFSALKLERFATFIILSIAIMVASFCIICTLLLMVTEKGKEIAILKAIGASDGAILRTFMTEGIIIGGIGTVFGVATGLAVCTGLSWFGLRLDPDVYYIDRLPINVSGWDFFTVAVAALTICTLATIYPATAASKLRPVDGLRYE